jgi:multidrug efflux system membrane fusion protein
VRFPDRAARAVAVAAVLAALPACSHRDEPATARPVLVEAPQALADGAGDAYPGAVRAEIENELSFRVAGKIEKRLVDAGAEVKAGQLLATLDPQDAKFNLDAAQADYSLASAEAARVRDLKQKGYTSQSQVDNADSRLKLAAAKLSLAQNQSRYTELKADADGVVTSVLAEVGETVPAGRPIFRFAAAGAREVLINVPEGRIGDVKSAERIGVTLWTQPGKAYAGKVRVLSPQADPQTRTHEVRVSITDADAAVALGVTATVVIGNKGAAQTFRLPASALGDDGRQNPRVWIVKGSPAAAQPVSVEVQQYLNDAVIVAGDLKPDDRVITAGVHLLTPGMLVQPLPRSAPAAL